MAVNVKHVYLDNPQPRLIREAADILKAGGIVVYPTDTIYGLGADLFNKEAMNRIFKIKKTSNHKLLSFVCPDLKDISEWALVPDYAYRVMKRVTPGPYTFVLQATKKVPKLLLQKRKTVGIRIPDSKVTIKLIEALGRPILSTSVPQGTDGYYTNPEEIADMYKHDIDLILDAGKMFNQPSTIVDLSSNEPAILREGSGPIDQLAY
ncbi:MAG: threonylcarbamoyl-AMP synthase [Caldithrix sp.]|nr:threonylcarbamoyl-AMP synthase [Caldithrix sp.]